MFNIDLSKAEVGDIVVDGYGIERMIYKIDRNLHYSIFTSNHNDDNDKNEKQSYSLKGEFIIGSKNNNIAKLGIVKLIKKNKKVFIPVTRIDQLKDGDRVKCTIMGVKIIDAKISIDKYGCIFICQNRQDGLKASNRKGYRYSWICYRRGLLIANRSFKGSLKWYNVEDLKKVI